MLSLSLLLLNNIYFSCSSLKWATTGGRPTRAGEDQVHVTFNPDDDHDDDGDAESFVKAGLVELEPLLGALPLPLPTHLPSQLARDQVVDAIDSFLSLSSFLSS